MLGGQDPKPHGQPQPRHVKTRPKALFTQPHIHTNNHAL